MNYRVDKNIHTHGVTMKIKDENNNDIFAVNEGNYFNSKVLNFFDDNDKKVMYIEEKKHTNFNTYNIYIYGELVGSINHNVMFFKHNFEITSHDIEFYIDGDCSSMEFEIYKGECKVAEVSKRSVLLSEAYEINLLSKEHKVFLLAVIIGIDYLLYDIGRINQM